MLVRALPHLAPRQDLLILNALKRQRPGWLSIPEIIDILWGHRLDGGVLAANRHIYVLMHRLRGAGHRIEGRYVFGYRLMDGLNPTRSGGRRPPLLQTRRRHRR